MADYKKAFIAFVLVLASLVILYVDFTNKLIFLISLVSTFIGSLLSKIEIIPGRKSTHKFSLLLLIVIIAIGIITSYYILFLEIAVGAYMGFFTAKQFRKHK